MMFHPVRRSLWLVFDTSHREGGEREAGGEDVGSHQRGAALIAPAPHSGGAGAGERPPDAEVRALRS